jgi:hypothetical protein
MGDTRYVSFSAPATFVGATVTAIVYTTITTTGDIAASATGTGIELTGNVLGYGTELLVPKNISKIHWNFKTNSSRINTINNNYSINLIFEQGFIIFRVRAVGKIIDHPDYEIQGNWSVPDTGTNPSSLSCSSTYIMVEPHQATLNWQYNCVYAEEGKKKEVITYFDGSLRDRQSLTKTNSNNIVLAAESIYDFNGRKAIAILPVPLTTQALSYATNLNVNTAGNKYSWKDFDIDKSDCITSTDSLKSTVGAGNYYSRANANKSGKKAYIPDAFGFPFKAYSTSNLLFYPISQKVSWL